VGVLADDGVSASESVSASSARGTRGEARAQTPSRSRAVMWTATAAATGAIIMAMELTAFRLYAPYFGNSIYVWGSMISVVLLALAVGYSLGGLIADRATTDAVLYWIVLGSGVYQLGILFLWRATLMAIWTWGDFKGPVVATTVIFVPPMTALAMTSPFVIRLLARAGHIGVTAGRVFALSTAGSIAGVLGTSFWLVPHFGTLTTMKILCAASIVIGAAGLMIRARSGVLLVLPLGLVLVAKAPPPPPTILWHGESAYNHILVREKDGLRWLQLNDTRFSQTTEKVGSVISGFYLDQFAVGPVLASPKNLLVLGMGAGGSIQMTRAVAPQIEVDAVEIDPQVVELAHEFFALPQNDARLHVHIADARPWLAEQTRKWDLVHVDLFQNGPWVPFYLTTVEFFELARSHMVDNGVLMLNVLDKSEKGELLSAMGATLLQVFPSVEELPTEKGNYILFAFARKRELSETKARLLSAAGPDWVADLAGKDSVAISEFCAQSGAVIFRDDKAPIEEITRHMLVEAGY
jgi:spermidine synthase